MMNFLIKQYGVFGNPVKHSLSPKIHDLFSKKEKICLRYLPYCVSKNNINDYLSNFFFNRSGNGANITLPFKKEAFKYANILTDRAKVSGTVNTLKKLENNSILGDNTDGIGLVYDLKRLNFIQHNSKILLLGSGGSAYAIIPSLLSLGCKVFVLNRTISKAVQLVAKFKKIGFIKIADHSLLSGNSFFNLIINATSSGIYNTVPFLPLNLISPKVFFYDLYYQLLYLTPFLKWCKKNGAIYLEDGLGMLVSQAAYSFLLWHNKFPDIIQVINTLKNIKCNLS